MFFLHPFVPGLQVVIFGGERSNIIEGLVLFGGVVLVHSGWNQPFFLCEEDQLVCEARQISYSVDIEWCAVGATGGAIIAKITIKFIAG